MSVFFHRFYNSLAQAVVTALLAHICFFSLSLYYFGIVVVSCSIFPTLRELELFIFLYIYTLVAEFEIFEKNNCKFHLDIQVAIYKFVFKFQT